MLLRFSFSFTFINFPAVQVFQIMCGKIRDVILWSILTKKVSINMGPRSTNVPVFEMRNVKKKSFFSFLL